MNYLKIWLSIMKEFDISANHAIFLEYAYLSSNNHNNKLHPGWCYASKLFIADLLHMKIRTLYNVLNDLDEKNLIIRNDKSGFIKTTDKYNDIHFIAQSEEEDTAHRLQKLQLSTAKVAVEGTAKIAPYNNSNKKKNNIDIYDHNPKNGSISKLSHPSFEKFWNLYGRQIGRKKCETKWEKIAQVDREKIIEHIPKYLKYLQRTGYDQKHPDTFLNNESWNDDYSANGLAEKKTHPR